MGEMRERLLFVLVLLVTVGVGVAAGMALRHRGDVAVPERHDLDDTVRRLEQDVRTLQAQLRARDAKVAALQDRLASAAAAPAPQPVKEPAPRPADQPAMAMITDERAAAPVVPRESEVSRRSPAASARATATAPATVEAALHRFYAYLDEANAGGPWRMRELMGELRAMGDVGAQALLRVLANGETADERRTAAMLLGSLQDKRALPLLQQIIENESDLLLRRAAAQSLRRLQVPEAIPMLESVVANAGEDRFVRMSAAVGLAQLERPLGVTALARIFDEATVDGRGREVAFRALVSLKDERPLPFMRQVLVSPVEVGYRLQAIRFVAAQGDRQSLALLQRVMDSPTEQASIREAATQAYTSIATAPAK